MLMKRIPFFLALLSIVGGVFISILFGINEDIFQKRISAGLEKNIKIQSMTDATEKMHKLESEQEKNWRYYQRFHFHATGIGAMMMGILLFLAGLNAPLKSVTIASFLVAIGGFCYPFVWLFAAIYGPEMGRAEAKEAFAIFGYMGGIFLMGGIYTLFLSLKYNFSFAKRE